VVNHLITSDGSSSGVLEETAGTNVESSNGDQGIVGGSRQEESTPEVICQELIRISTRHQDWGSNPGPFLTMLLADLRALSDLRLEEVIVELQTFIRTVSEESLNAEPP
jgi:hypothetical protein